jgi:DNA primase
MPERGEILTNGVITKTARMTTIMMDQRLIDSIRSLRQIAAFLQVRDKQLFDERYPQRYLLSSDPAKRAGKIFIDYLRNGRGNTAIGAWSPRVREGIPIAAPLTWEASREGIRPYTFTNEKPSRS